MLLFAVLFSTATGAQHKTTYIVGTENIVYFPHYDFVKSRDSYVAALLTQFAAQHNLEIQYVALPNKRLHLALEQGIVDFAYPDNPNWKKLPKDPSLKKHFSTTIAEATGSTIVRKSDIGKGLSGFNSLVVPFGFSPIKWLTLISNKEVKLVEVGNAMQALEMVALGRVSGADIEYHVASHLIKRHKKFHNLTMDPELPYDIVGFKMSSYRHPEILEQLNRFIAANPEQISLLKNQYQLFSAEQIINSQPKNNIGKN
ncbi:type 2 periplasmic-binding domain-containing protein [Planctobacterium marinum]|uniref:transporter substrate-binding domain-containing protein n=1 Tax=Planctobacterium marinum TaxID=1631968 RepID=UPI001E3CF26D|nr:transporter substrate-binding domain-containing protein [Planctobacterium marinum]MCC2607995.1 hypothetical protein [Planctobacterium marinum]